MGMRGIYSKKITRRFYVHMQDKKITKQELFKTLNDKNISIMNFLTLHQQETGLESKNKQGGMLESLNINPKKMLGFLSQGRQGMVPEGINKNIDEKSKKSDKLNDID